MPASGMAELMAMPVMASFGRAAGIAGHFDVAEAVEGESRLPDLFAVALEDVGVDRSGRCGGWSCRSCRRG